MAPIAQSGRGSTGGGAAAGGQSGSAQHRAPSRLNRPTTWPGSDPTVRARAARTLHRRIQLPDAVNLHSDQADAGVVLRRPDDASRSGADLLLVDVPLSRHAA